MSFFIMGDELQVVVIGTGEAGLKESRLWHGADTLFIEHIFEMFKLERKCVSKYIQ